jgi:CRISPR-associated endoribonuclease Cas6
MAAAGRADSHLRPAIFFAMSATYRSSMNGSASAPNSATINFTRASSNPLRRSIATHARNSRSAYACSADVRWVEWARWSGRQQALLKMGGLVGALSLRLAGLEPFWPFLALAPWVHVGKGATMGLGAMRVTAA